MRHENSTSAEVIGVPVAANVQVFAGAIVVANATGFAVGGSTATGLTYLGRAEEYVDNRNGADGAKVVRVRRLNAFKWAKGRVLLTVKSGEPQPDRRPGMTLAVDDDGAGIAPDRIAHVLQRGVRGDERVQGHGIGLAIVQDIVGSYRGELRVGPSPELGGTRFEVVFPPGL